MPSAALNMTFLTTSQTNKETTINDALQRIEDATQKSTTLDLTGLTTYTFTSNWYDNFLFDASGNSAAVTFTLPASDRLFAIRNNTVYDYDLTFDGATVELTIPGGTTYFILSTGTELILIHYIGGAEISIITDATTARTLSLSDMNNYLRFTNVASISVTVPDNADEAIPIGSVCTLRQADVGQITIVEDTAVTVNTPQTLLSFGPGATISLIKVGVDEWDLTGDLELVP
jgi:hypothetical protein